jgi:acetylornithine/N-succinyldiaminopimelate aminotransferase
VTAKGERIIETVRSWKHPNVKEVRGVGLMIGIVVTVAPDKIKELCIQRGLLVLTAGADVVRLLPPLVITDGEIDRGLALLKDALDTAIEA